MTISIFNSQHSASLHLPWVEKYRPSTLENLSSHEHIISTLIRFIEKRQLPHLLFYGPPGTGKTSTILALARRLYGSKDGQGKESLSSNVLEFNASDDRGIDIIRDQVKTFASTKNIFTSSSSNVAFKLVILDEADFMTNAAQDALRRIIEKYVKHVRFCIICNDISKITPAIQSRCTLFRFAPLPSSSIMERLNTIIENEKLTVTDDGKAAILKIANGDMRKVLNVLQSAASAGLKIDEATVYESTSLPTPKCIDDLLNIFLNQDFDRGYEKLKNIQTTYGYSIMDIIKGLADAVLNLQLPSNKVLLYLIDSLSQLEIQHVSGGHESIFAGALVGHFQIARALITTPVH